jgi:hypothetical protein
MTSQNHGKLSFEIEGEISEYLLNFRQILGKKGYTLSEQDLILGELEDSIRTQLSLENENTAERLQLILQKTDSPSDYPNKPTPPKNRTSIRMDSEKALKILVLLGFILSLGFHLAPWAKVTKSGTTRSFLRGPTTENVTISDNRPGNGGVWDLRDKLRYVVSEGRRNEDGSKLSDDQVRELEKQLELVVLSGEQGDFSYEEGKLSGLEIDYNFGPIYLLTLGSVILALGTSLSVVLGKFKNPTLVKGFQVIASLFVISVFVWSAVIIPDRHSFFEEKSDPVKTEQFEKIVERFKIAKSSFVPNTEYIVTEKRGDLYRNIQWGFCVACMGAIFSSILSLALRPARLKPNEASSGDGYTVASKRQ